MKADGIAGIKEGLFDADMVAEYLLWTLNHRVEAEANMAECDPKRRMSFLVTPRFRALISSDIPYTELLPLPETFQPTPDLQVLLDALASRLGLLRKGGERDLDVAREFLIKAFREGKIGRWTLDDLETRLPPLSYQKDIDPTPGAPHVSPGVDQPIQTQAEMSLNAKVSATVESFLEEQMAGLRASEEGRDMSAAQQKKRDNKNKAEEREAKWRAKGIPVGVNRRTAKARGPGRPGSVKPRGRR